MNGVLAVPPAAPLLPRVTNIRKSLHRGDNKVESFTVFVRAVARRRNRIRSSRVGQITTVKSCLLRVCTECGSNSRLEARSARSVHQSTRKINEVRTEFIEGHFN